MLHSRSRLVPVSFGLLMLGCLWPVAANAQGRSSPRGDRTVEAADDAPIDFQRAKGLLQKRNRGESLTADEEAYLKRAIAARRNQEGDPEGRGKAQTPRDSTGLIPLDAMSADDRYEGQSGGLYGDARNAPSAALQAAAEGELKQIVPRNRAGQPAADGRIVFVSLSMSNATQEFARFKQISDADQSRSPLTTVVDCAQGGQAMAEWAPPNARTWSVALERLAQAGVTPEQVQVAWVKLANKAPRGNLEEHGRKLERDTRQVLQNAKQRFPNLRIVYLGSRTYGGYAGGNLNPEPFAYESAFPVRWLIEAQAKQDPELNWEPSRGDVRAPLLLWGPYLWADGTQPRPSDQLVWLREDFVGDGTHPSGSGRDKVARMLLDFCQHNDLARTWYLGKSADAR